MLSLRFSILALLLSAGPIFAAPPNVVYLCSDDQRHDTIRALGNTHLETPTIDKMVERGFTFTHCFCQGSMQGAVCVPSRAMFLTGRSLFRVDAQIKDAPTWPEVFRKAGYHTVGIGKWHNGPASYAKSFDNGGPIFFGGMGNQNKVNIYDFNPDGKYPKTNLKVGTAYSTKMFADAAVEFINTYDDKKPFFLYVTFTVPHDPRTPPAGWENKYDPKKLPLPKNYLPKHPFNNGDMLLRDEKLLDWPRTEDQIRKELANYYAMISHLDAQVGRIQDALKKGGFDKNTVVIFTSDHGLAIGSHGLLGKQNLYDHSMRPPLVMTGPKIPANKKSSALVYLFDIFPTVAELCEVKLPEKVEGKSLVPVMTGKAEKVRDEIFGVYRSFQRCVRTTEWKLIRYPHINHTQLFNIKDDPDELKDLARDPKFADKVKEMMKLLEAQQKAFGDTQPLTSAKPEPFEIELKK
ncbi:MAG: sulfatase-like hydrolase/transferase [Planctomycetia bacterium]|nr:sulfatase-like hydrolase/transferase [Planctomycetia bacterium]